MQIAKRQRSSRHFCYTVSDHRQLLRLADILLTISVEEQRYPELNDERSYCSVSHLEMLMFIRLCIQKGNQVNERTIDTHNVIQKIKR